MTRKDMQRIRPDRKLRHDSNNFFGMIHRQRLNALPRYDDLPARRNGAVCQSGGYVSYNADTPPIHVPVTWGASRQMPVCTQ